jgi:hypothetical protein
MVGSHGRFAALASSPGSARVRSLSLTPSRCGHEWILWHCSRSTCRSFSSDFGICEQNGGRSIHGLFLNFLRALQPLVVPLLYQCCHCGVVVMATEFTMPNPGSNITCAFPPCRTSHFMLVRHKLTARVIGLTGILKSPLSLACTRSQVASVLAPCDSPHPAAPDTSKRSHGYQPCKTLSSITSAMCSICDTHHGCSDWEILSYDTSFFLLPPVPPA